MPPATRTRLRPEDRRAQLIGIGLELLASRRSLDDLPVEELATAAGTSKALLFHYFGSKQGFQVAVRSISDPTKLSADWPGAAGRTLVTPLARYQPSAVSASQKR